MRGLNKRIVRIGIESQSGDFMFFEDLDIRCTGEKWAGPESSMARIQLSNLTREQKNFILTVASPMQINVTGKRNPLLVTVDVGREGVFDPFRLFQGFCYASYVTMPPDISIILESTVQSLLAATMTDINFGALSDLFTISQSIATTYGLTLDLKNVQNKQIANFNYTGGLNDALNKLSMTGLVSTFVDNQIMYVVDKGKPVTTSPFELNMSTGMVGIPEVCESGVNARSLIIPDIQLGGGVKISSTVNPAVDGEYIATNIKYEIANRDNPFWYNLFLTNANYLFGVQ